MPPILLLGCGRMGSALLSGWTRDGLAPSVVVDRKLHPGAAGPHAVVADVAGVPTGRRFAAVVLAVKPQAADAVLPALAPHLAEAGSDAVVLSIMAGRTVGSLAARLPPGTTVVRAMPNTPAAIGRGISVAVAGPGVDADRRALCDRLLRAGGAVRWVEDERLLDAVTAVSGSGPAYLFLLAELLERAGIAEGLPPVLARELARGTVSGAGALLEHSPEDAAALRRAVTSPNGTTAAALEVLMREEAWPRSVAAAVAAAAARSRTLAG
ncbi:MAG: pyrroline-5-carboxylate reductase [Gluconacetobacter diazotrophicus]|nr:pyrroline-5-carboxylate reductase [Gluconacetobacter diazotrophicus]